MNKIISFLSFLLISINLNASDSTYLRVTDDGSFYFENVTMVENAGKDKLFNTARKYITSIYKNGSQLKVDDRESGQIINNASTKYNLGFGKGNALIRFMITIDVKDDRYRIRLSDFTGENLTGVYDEKSKDLDLAKIQAEFKEGKASGKEQAIWKGLEANVTQLIEGLQKEITAVKNDDF